MIIRLNDTVTLAPNKDIRVHIFEIKWIMTYSVFFVLLLINLGHILCTFYFMRRARLISYGRHHIDSETDTDSDDYLRFGDENFDEFKRKVRHNSDKEKKLYRA